MGRETIQDSAVILFRFSPLVFILERTEVISLNRVTSAVRPYMHQSAREEEKEKGEMDIYLSHYFTKI